MSSARTTRAPSSATFSRSPSPETRRRNSRHSSLSGSSVAIFGMWMSPVRVCHSPYVVDRLPRRLLVDRDLAVELHVVEDGHLLRADDGHLSHLVRVEPGQVHVRDASRREAQVAEDDVLDARLQEVAARARSPPPGPRRAGRGSRRGRGRRATRARSRTGGCGRGSGGFRTRRGPRRARPSRRAPSASARQGGRGAGARA